MFFEVVIKDYMEKYILETAIISENQHGFIMKGCSTHFNLVIFYKEVSSFFR